MSQVIDWEDRPWNDL